ncbi:MAG: ATP-binding protein [Muribaculum sp.]|nr:ATP-binding protein [Muribaculum sp.]
MREYLRIENFGPVTFAEINDIKPFTVIIGKSATGKSSIMKVVALMRYIYKLANIRSYFHLSNIKRSPFKIDFNGLMRKNGLRNMLKPDSKIVYSVSFDNGHSYVLEYQGKLKAIPDICVEDLVFLKGAFVSENRNTISSWLGSGIERSSLSMGFYFDETLSLFLNATENYKECNIPYLDIKMSVSKSSNGLRQYILSRSDNHKYAIKLREASSGMKSTIPLEVIVDFMAKEFNFKDAYNRSVFDYLRDADRLQEYIPAENFVGFRPIVSIHVEEPELSLDPETQIRMQTHITETLFHNSASDRQCMLMYATHSPYLANHINLLMAEWEKNHSKGVNPEDVDVFITSEDGLLRSAIVFDDKNRKIVNSEFLAKDIQSMYSNYYSLRND